MLVLLTLALAVHAAAQGREPGGARTGGPGQPHLVETEVPQREPRILERTVTPEGLLNTVVELPAEADTYIASEWPNQNFGTGALYLGYNLTGDNNFGAERMLLRFDVTGSIPQGVVINDGRLRLYLDFSSPADDVPMGTILRQTASIWSETAVTWNDEPVWGPIRAENEVGSDSGWYEWDVTELIGDWASGAQDNHGVEIIGDERIQQRERVFYSRGTAGSQYPQLVVDYTDFGDTDPPIVTVDALPAFVGRDFTVSWSGSDPGGSGIAAYDVQYRVDGGDWADWIVEGISDSADFTAGQDGKFYEFRARGKDRAGNVEAFDDAEASTTVDAQPPTTVVDPLPAITGSTSFTVSWTGEDSGSGIQYYDVQYRFNEGSWVPWQNQTLAMSTTFTAMNDGFYEFEARAVDKFGLQEDFEDEPEAAIIVDAEPPFVEPRTWLPLIIRNG
jgi:hypothetical protein